MKFGENDKKRFFMTTVGVILCAIAVGFFKCAQFGVDPFQCFAQGIWGHFQGSRSSRVKYVFIAMRIFCPRKVISHFKTSTSLLPKPTGAFFVVTAAKTAYPAHKGGADGSRNEGGGGGIVNAALLLIFLPAKREQVILTNTLYLDYVLHLLHLLFQNHSQESRHHPNKIHFLYKMQL